jgi:hypothetical protein
MATNARPANGALALSEIREFASFGKGTQRYIRRSLDVGLNRRDAVKRWSRDIAEAASIRAQERVYRRLAHLREHIPDDASCSSRSAKRPRPRPAGRAASRCSCRTGSKRSTSRSRARNRRLSQQTSAPRSNQSPRGG